MRRPALLVAATAVAVVVSPAAAGLSATAAHAATCTAGISGPNDPQFARAERAPGSSTFNAEQWYLYDCMPQSAPAATDPEGAAGMSINAAWQKFGRGNSKITVAYMEGGVNWRLDDSKDLRKQAYLNTGELPLPEDASGHTHGTYDLDGDGVVTVDDYKDDPRVHRPFLHQATAGGITSEDLIVAFSNGKDDDHNGYVDDISGWNFHRDTNDPQTDQSAYHHADGEQEQAVATADNNFLGAGLCPNCRLLSVKMGDEAIDRPDRVAEAIVFAVDAGAKVIDTTTAALGQTPSMRQAVQYAYDHGVVITWASNDFESADHTEGMAFDHVWPGNSIVSDKSNRNGSSSPSDATAVTFRSRSSLTSYGAHALFSVPNNDGSTSTGIPTQAGVAALVASEGLNVNAPLDANEVYQVVRATASPIDNTPCPNCFAGEPGAEWNIQYGYGRPNLLKAMQAVHDGEIPPTADITSPHWYDEVDPTRQSTVALTANVAAKRSPSYTYDIQYAVGPQPLDSDWHTFASGSGSSPQTVHGTLDLSQIPSSFWAGAYTAPTTDRLSIERYDVSLRVQVHDASHRLGEDRRVFQLRHDPSEIQAFHKFLGTSLESSPSLADIEGTGVLDTIVAGSDGTVWAFRPDGSTVPGWPVHTALARGVDPAYPYNYLGAAAWKSGAVTRPHEPIDAPLAVGDLDHNGKLWVVVSGQDGHVYAWDGAGRLRKGYPLATDRAFARQSVPPPDTPYVRNKSTGNVGGAALADLEGNGKLDIVFGGWDGRVYAWRPDGTPVPGWPVSTDTPETSHHPAGTTQFARDYKVATTPTIVDVDGDGRPDVVVALQDTAFGASGSPVYGYVVAFSSQGTRHAGGALLPNYPVQVPAAAQGYGTAQDFITEGVQTPVAYDAPDGPHLVANAGLSTAVDINLKSAQVDRAETPGSLPPDGTQDPGGPMVHFTTAASLGHVGGLPTLLAVQSGSAGVGVAGGIVEAPGSGLRVASGEAAWNPQTGAAAPTYTQRIQGLGFLTAPAIADLNGDGKPDILQAADSGALHAWDGVTGQPLPGWPKWTGGWDLFTPAVGDLTGDGKVEVVTGLREGWLHAYSTAGLATANAEAWHWHQNDRDTGHYGDDTRPPVAVRDLTVTRAGTTDQLHFTAPGDDWAVGTASSYQVFRSAKPITQDSLTGAVSVPVSTKPAVAGTRQTLSIPVDAARPYVAVRAVDKAGNLGPLRLTSATGSAAATPEVAAASGTRSTPVSNGRAAETLAFTGADPVLPGIAVLLLAGVLVLRRRRTA